VTVELASLSGFETAHNHLLEPKRNRSTANLLSAEARALADVAPAFPQAPATQGREFVHSRIWCVGARVFE
jgi:hypothetical protein